MRRARERKRENKHEREKSLEAEKMKENENLCQTLWAGFFFFEKGQDEFGYIVFGLNGSQWIFS